MFNKIWGDTEHNWEYGWVRRAIQEKIEFLSQYQNLGDAMIVGDIKQLKKEITDLLEREDLAWKQSAK